MKNNKDFKEKLIKRAYLLSCNTIKMVDKFPQKRSAWVIADQLLRAITSIAANIIESQAASSKKDFIRFLTYALKSGNESKFWLALAKKLDSKLSSEIENLLKETDEIVKILGSSIYTLKKKSQL